ncbi:MAG: excinuclease ABC subunit B [Verrucomicrobiales bacterium]|nr:excinuclease ABC subunit B [Verrucomicrobiales bacterium]
MSLFEISSAFSPQGDQEQAIAKLTKSLLAGNNHQTLLGVTGSGKTFTVANVIAAMGKPTLVMSHNKTLAAQLYSELKGFFPNNAVEYFVSYFDYYQPEAYIPRTDTYIEKDSSINDEIERLRLSSMSSLLTRKDVIVVASVSCIYGLGSPEDYQNMMVPVQIGQSLDRDDFLRDLVAILYERNDIEFLRGKFRVRGDVVEVYPAYLDEEAIRVEFFGDEIDRITSFDPQTGNGTTQLDQFTFYPAKQFVTPKDKMTRAIKAIREEMKERIEYFEKNQQYLEAQRIKQRTEYDIEMMQEMGFCQGIENYSRHLTGRPPGAKPGTLIDFFPPGEFFTVIDESHVSVPQIGGMYEGDRSRKQTLVDFGFRLPSALDNRPLKFDEYMASTGQRLYVSATPAKFEIENSRVGNKGYIPHKRKRIGEDEMVPERLPRISGSQQSISSFDPTKKGADLIVEQIIRPTGLLDPILTLRPLKGQIDETIELCRQRIEKNERVLVTTLTKRTAEDLTDYLRNVGLAVRYIHADVDAIERVEILRSLRAAEFDILVGINLLREGLDLPEVSLVCILDADKEGFLRSQTSLIQTVGRAARHVNGEAVLFADNITDSIQNLIDITEYRRRVQQEYNEKHGITPTSTKRGDQETLRLYMKGKAVEDSLVAESGEDVDTLSVIRELEEEMQEAATKLEFERAALIRDQINKLKKDAGETPLKVKRKKVRY